jgi:hypothetical protein
MSATDVTSQDTRVLAAVLKRLLRGERVSPASLSLGTGLTAGEAEAALTRLDAAGTLYMADGIVRAAYPLSGIPTRHRGATAYANCAIDALAVSLMVDEPVHIESECAHCGGPITVQMSGDRVLAPSRRRPWSCTWPRATVAKQARRCSPGALTSTSSARTTTRPGGRPHPERPGNLLPLAEAITWSRERFALVIRLVRGDDISPTALSRYVQWLASRRE